MLEKLGGAAATSRKWARTFIVESVFT